MTLLRQRETQTQLVAAQKERATAEGERELFKRQRDQEAAKYAWAYPQWREDYAERRRLEPLCTGLERELNSTNQLCAQLAKDLEAARNDRQRTAAYERFVARLMGLP